MIIIYTLSLFVLIIVVLILGMVHLGFRAPRNREKGDPSNYNISFIEVSISTVADKKLFGWFLEVEKSSETILLMHGWGGNAELMLPMAVPFHQAGLSVLLIDSRNHGNSDSGSVSSMPRFAEDVGNSIDWLKLHYPSRVDKIALLGHSVGAGAVLLEATTRKDINAVISVSAFAHPEWMMRRHLKPLHIPKLFIHFMFRYIEWVIGQRFSNIAPLNTVCMINCPILLVHGTHDNTVPVDDARSIIRNCPGSNITLLEIEGADHDSVDKVEQHAVKLINFLSQSGFLSNSV